MDQLIKAIFLFLSLTIGISTGFAESLSPSETEGLEKVKVQLKWRHQFQFAGYYAALEKGFYQDAGLDVTLVEHTPGPSPIDKLIRGTVDFAVADAGALIYRSTGVPIVVLASIFQHSPAILLTLSDSNIDQLTDLKGQPIELRGGNLNAELKSMLLNGGLTNDDIYIASSGTNPDVLIDKKVVADNAYITNEPFFLKQKGIQYKYFHPRDYNVDFYGDILLTTEKQISKRPDVVKRFRKATLKGWEYAVKNPDKIVDFILAKYNSQNKTRDHLMYEAEESIKLIDPNVVEIGYMSEKRWRDIKDIFEKQGQITTTFDLTGFMYKPDEFSQLFVIYEQYKTSILLTGASIVGLFLLFHIVSLRLTVRSKTTELNEAKRIAEEDARTDPLTNLSNRRCFFENLSRDLSVSMRKNLPVSLIAADIDYFKNINDEFGHAAGDEALRQTSKIFKDNIRQGDIAARMGGEEFMILCLNSSLDEARKFAERLRTKIEQNVISSNDKTFKVTCSFGVAEAITGQDEEQIIHYADQALYKAKDSGRNIVCTWKND